jgi:hypothetical protein
MFSTKLAQAPPQANGPYHFFCEKLLQRRLIQRRFHQKLLQLAVLVFQGLK